MSKSPVPAGMYVQLNLDLIEGGNYRKQVEEAIQRGFRELMNWEKASGKTDGTYTVSSKITIGRVPNTTDHYAVKATVNLTTPAVVRRSLVKGANGRLLCQPEGATVGDPDQISLFDGQGMAKGTVDTSTGELLEDPDDEHVAGRVPATA